MKIIFVAIWVFVAVSAVEFQINNNTPKIIWIGIMGNNGQPNLEEGGFVLNAFGQRLVSAPPNWGGLIWARTYCNHKTKLCETGSCGRKIQCSGTLPNPPVTLVEIQLKAGKSDDNYGISLIDGFNIGAKITPLNGKGDCLPSSCLLDLNAKCSEELSVIGSGGAVVGCQSSCNKYYSSCCRAKTKIPGHNCTGWPADSTNYFKYNCPDVHNYIIHEINKNFTCSANTYLITFGDNFK